MAPSGAVSGGDRASLGDLDQHTKSPLPRPSADVLRRAEEELPPWPRESHRRDGGLEHLAGISCESE